VASADASTPSVRRIAHFDHEFGYAAVCRVGEQRAGPASRGMDLMKASIEHGRLVIDTGTIIPGRPAGTNTTRQAPAGPFCT